MKVVAAPINMLAWSDYKGSMHPLRFKYEGKVIKVDRIVSQELNRHAGNDMLVFTCQSLINGEDRVFELRYEVRTCKLILFKI